MPAGLAVVACSERLSGTGPLAAALVAAALGVDVCARAATRRVQRLGRSARPQPALAARDGRPRQRAHRGHHAGVLPQASEQLTRAVDGDGCAGHAGGRSFGGQPVPPISRAWSAGACGQRSRGKSRLRPAAPDPSPPRSAAKPQPVRRARARGHSREPTPAEPEQPRPRSHARTDAPRPPRRPSGRRAAAPPAPPRGQAARARPAARAPAPQPTGRRARTPRAPAGAVLHRPQTTLRPRPSSRAPSEPSSSAASGEPPALEQPLRRPRRRPGPSAPGR